MPDVTATDLFTVEEIERRIRIDDVFGEQIEDRIFSWIVRQAIAAARVSAGGDAEIQRAVLAAEQDITPRIAAHLARVAMAGAEASLGQLGLKAGETTFRQEMLGWANNRSAELVQQITETTMNAIRAAVVSTLVNSVGPAALAAAIRDKVVGLGQLTARARAQTIARTETHDAASHGADQAAARSGIDYMRQWLAVSGGRTRSSHAAANGQMRGPNEAFSVGGFAIMRPGQGPAQEAINCRCVLGYRPVGFTRKAKLICT